MSAGASGDADLSAVGALLAEPARCSVLLALADGRRLPASTLAKEAGVAPSTMSGHLGRLLEGGLITAHVHGRHRYYEVAGPEVGRLIETVAQLSPAQPVRSLRQGTKAHRLRLARRCYDHMGGRLAVAIARAMLDKGFLDGHDASVDFDPDHGLARRLPDPAIYHLTEVGRSGLATAIGFEPENTIDGVPCCVDWTEQRHHLAGALGAGLLERFTRLGWVHVGPRDRSLTITESGQHHFCEVFGLDPSLLSTSTEPAK
jgi:DNA-binding transcriptional ArsR family regulator